MTQAPGQEDVQALHRRRVPALRVGPHVRGRGRRTSRAPRARTPATPSAPRARRFPAWAGMTAYNRGQVLYRLAEMMEARATDLAARVHRARRGRSGDRPHRLVRGLGRQARAGARLLEPGRRAVLQLHGSRADRRRRDPRAGGAAAPRARLAPRSRARRRQHGRRGRVRGAPARGGRARRGARHLRLPGGVVNILTGFADELAPVARRPHGRERDRPHRRRRPRPPSSSAPRPRTSSASSARRPTRRARGRSRPSSS